MYFNLTISCILVIKSGIKYKKDNGQSIYSNSDSDNCKLYDFEIVNSVSFLFSFTCVVHSIPGQVVLDCSFFFK